MQLQRYKERITLQAQYIIISKVGVIVIKQQSTIETKEQNYNPNN